jgi:hypothetical protein
MLGQHPQMYGLPELKLFNSETVAEWIRANEAPGHHQSDGMLRAIAQLVFGAQTTDLIPSARRWLRQRSALTTGQLLKRLAARVYPAIPVEKSPGTTARVDTLERAYRMFPHARFLHLVRHPKGFGESVMDALRKKSKYGPVPRVHWLVNLSWYGRPRIDGSDPDPQFAWFGRNKAIADFLRALPDTQHLLVRGEELLGNPDAELLRIAGWLRLRADAEAIDAMKHPERSPYAHVGPPGAEYGNSLLFLRNPALRHERAREHTLDGPVSWRRDGRSLRADVIELAREFGYS